jgi:Flp pilus assembly secretin CpaC
MATLSATAAVAASGDFTVALKQGRRITLSGQAANVVVGDSTIADVAVTDGHSIVVLGKGYGTTLVMVTDHNGHVLMDSNVTVAPPESQRVTVYYGGAVSVDFSCVRHCQPIKDTPAATAIPGSPGM